ARDRREATGRAHEDPAHRAQAGRAGARRPGGTARPGPRRRAGSCARAGLAMTVRAAAHLAVALAIGAGCAHDEHAGGMPHRFEHADEWAKKFDDPSRDAWQHPDDVLGALALAPGQTIADIGAGTGYFTVRLARPVPG